MWPTIEASEPLSIPALCDFMERWRPEVTHGFAAAPQEEIRRLAAPHGGVGALPSVYRDFLQRMGASTGELRLVRGSTSVSALLAQRDEDPGENPDPQRYVRFSTGSVDMDGELLADFFDLAARTADGRDAAVLRMDPNGLADPAYEPWRPFESLSDLLRSVTISRLCMEAFPRKKPTFPLGNEQDARVRCTELLGRLGFALSTLGASPRIIPLEHEARNAIALLSRDEPGTMTLLYLRARDRVEEIKLAEIVADHLPTIVGER